MTHGLAQIVATASSTIGHVVCGSESEIRRRGQAGLTLSRRVMTMHRAQTRGPHLKYLTYTLVPPCSKEPCPEIFGATWRLKLFRGVDLFSVVSSCRQDSAYFVNMEDLMRDTRCSGQTAHIPSKTGSVLAL